MIRTLACAAILAAAFAAQPLPAFAQSTAPAATHDAASVSVGSIAISGAFTRATLPNAPVGGGFFTLTNTGSQDDRLVSASADFADVAQIHAMAMQGDVMKMGQLKDGLVIPAGETVTLAPGGYHLMFMGLKHPLVEGETVAVTLTFEKAGSVTLDLPIGDPAADAPIAGMDHGGH